MDNVSFIAPAWTGLGGRRVHRAQPMTTQALASEGLETAAEMDAGLLPRARRAETA